MIYSKNLLKFKPYVGNNITETEDNIYHGVLSLIANDDEYVRFIFEELDAASHGNDVARQFAMNSGINSSHFSGLLKSPSSIDRAGGPQQFFVSSLVSIFGSDNVLPHRINIVKKLIENGMNKGILSKYVTGGGPNMENNVGLYKDLKLPKTREEYKYKGWIYFFMYFSSFLSFLCYIIPVFIALPIAIYVNIKLAKSKPISLRLKIITLIFVSVVAGIILIGQDEVAQKKS